MSGATRIALLLVSLLLSSPAFGQTAAAPPSPHGAQPGVGGARGAGVPDVPAGPGAIRGRVVHASRPDAVSGLPVVLYALPAGGAPGLRGATTNATGEFAFEDIAIDPDTSYLVGVRFAGIPFGMRTTFAEGETERSIEVTVSDPSPDADAAEIEIGEVRIRFERGCDDLRVIESIGVRNPTERVFFVPDEERGARAPIAEMLLPEGASEVQVPFGSFPQGLDQAGRRLRFWGPLYPGAQEIEFGYGLAGGGDAGTLERGFPAGAERVVVLTPAAGDPPGAEGLRPDEPTQVDGRAYHTASAESVAADTRLALDIGPVERTVRTGVALVDARFWLELDDAALVVDERYNLENTTGAPAGGSGDAPLLCIPVPPGAQELRFSQSALSMGLTRDPSGALAVSGPAPPGSSSVAIRYLLPNRNDQRNDQRTDQRNDPGNEKVAFARRFEQALPLLSLVVADTGLVAESQRLHRLRPIRSEDRSYMHLEAFEIERGETVTLTLEPLEAPRAFPRSAAAILLALMSLGTVLFLAGPLGSGPRASEAEGVAPERAERESVIDAIRDLDHDFETGKIAEDDYHADRHALQARAVALLQAERSEPAAPADARPACPTCDAAIEPGWRFCADCGAEISPPSVASNQGAA